jgi:hypothetical protein
MSHIDTCVQHAHRRAAAGRRLDPAPKSLHSFPLLPRAFRQQLEGKASGSTQLGDRVQEIDRECHLLDRCPREDDRPIWEPECLPAHSDPETVRVLPESLHSCLLANPDLPPGDLSRTWELTNGIGPEIFQNRSSNLANAIDQRLATPGAFWRDLFRIKVSLQLPFEDVEPAFRNEDRSNPMAFFQCMESKKLDS